MAVINREIPWWEGHPELLPPDPDLQPIHQRDYLVRSWKMDDSSFLLRGAVMDTKPGELIAERIAALGGEDDGAPLTIHHMVIDLEVSFPELVIQKVGVVISIHPQPSCPFISESYQGLVGLPIARGFIHQVRELFGGPRGCTHTTALLQAMAPVALQSVFAMSPSRRRAVAPKEDEGGPSGQGENSFMRDTCHVWSSAGELWQNVTVGQAPPLALPMQARLVHAGLPPDALNLPPA